MERKKDSLPHFRPDLPRRLIRRNMRRFQERPKHRGLKSSPRLRSGVVTWGTTQPPVTSTSFPLKGALPEASYEGFKITSNTAATDINSCTRTRMRTLSLQWHQMLQTFACSRQFSSVSVLELLECSGLRRLVLIIGTETGRSTEQRSDLFS